MHQVKNASSQSVDERNDASLTSGIRKRDTKNKQPGDAGLFEN